MVTEDMLDRPELVLFFLFDALDQVAYCDLKPTCKEASHYRPAINLFTGPEGSFSHPASARVHSGWRNSLLSPTAKSVAISAARISAWNEDTPSSK